MGAYPRYCVQCGSGLNPGIRFCGNCGHAAAPADAEAGYAAPSRDSGYPAPASFSAPPGFSAPPTGPAYPPPPAPSPPPPADSSPPLTGPAYPPTSPSYAPPPGRAAPPPRPSSPPPPAQYALPAGSPPPPASPRPPSPGDGTAQFGTSWMDEVGFNPQWEQAPPALPPSTDAHPGDGRQRPRRPLTIALFVLVAAVLVVPALLIVHAFHGLGGGSHAAAAQPASKRPTQSSSAAPTERAAASALAALLAQSVTDRDTIVSAVGAVNHCTSGLSQAPQAFRDAATSRQRLLQQLARMAGRSALPAAMLRELSGAWQASAAVDADLGKWAQDEVSRGCTKNDHGDANFQASNTPDVQASNHKTAFIGRWNPIAAKYGLTRYSTSQL